MKKKMCLVAALFVVFVLASPASAEAPRRPYSSELPGGDVVASQLDWSMWIVNYYSQEVDFDGRYLVDGFSVRGEFDGLTGCMFDEVEGVVSLHRYGLQCDLGSSVAVDSTETHTLSWTVDSDLDYPVRLYQLNGVFVYEVYGSVDDSFPGLPSVPKASGTVEALLSTETPADVDAASFRELRPWKRGVGHPEPYCWYETLLEEKPTVLLGYINGQPFYGTPVDWTGNSYARRRICDNQD